MESIECQKCTPKGGDLGCVVCKGKGHLNEADLRRALRWWQENYVKHHQRYGNQLDYYIEKEPQLCSRYGFKVLSDSIIINVLDQFGAKSTALGLPFKGDNPTLRTMAERCGKYNFGIKIAPGGRVKIIDLNEKEKVR